MTGKTGIRWSIDDLMDFEYFLYHDESNTDSTEDRRIYLEKMKPAIDGNPEQTKNRPFIFHIWLEEKRKKETEKQDKTTPGLVFRQIIGIIKFLFIITGFFSGAGLCFSFLVYKGLEPLNVSSYLGIFLLPQIFLLVAALLFFLLRNSIGSVSLTHFFIWNMLLKLMETVKQKASRHPDRETLNRFKSAWGIARGRSRCYGSVFPYPLFISTQVFAVFFNIGLLTATILKVLGSDLAFGWQSTLQLGSGAVYSFVKLISIPWSFFLDEPFAHPSLAQIEGTRMVLKDGISHLTTPDLVSWWPFLCLCILFYGLVPRVILVVLSYVMERKTISKIKFDNMACDMLLLKLTSPSFNIPGDKNSVETEKNSNEQKTGTIISNNEKQQNSEGEAVLSPFLVLVPNDIFDDINDHELKVNLQKLFGTGFEKKISIEGNAQLDEKILSEHIKPATVSRIVYLAEAWQPPILETINFIKKIRESGGKSMRIHILLIGKPEKGSFFTSPSSVDVLAWKHTINKFADANIRLDLIPGNTSSQHEVEPYV